MSTSIDRDSDGRQDAAGDSPEVVRTRASRLQHAMDLRGIRTNELDRKADLGKGWTSRFLSGKKPRPSPDTIDKICKALAIRQDWLIHGRGEMNEDGDPGLSVAKIRSPAPTTDHHPDIEATIQVWRNRKTWSRPALQIADEIAKLGTVSIEEWPNELDKLEIVVQSVTNSYLKR